MTASSFTVISSKFDFVFEHEVCVNFWDFPFVEAPTLLNLVTYDREYRKFNIISQGKEERTGSSKSLQKGSYKPESWLTPHPTHPSIINRVAGFPKNKLAVWLVSNCDTKRWFSLLTTLSSGRSLGIAFFRDSRREKLVGLLRKHITIDILGKFSIQNASQVLVVYLTTRIINNAPPPQGSLIVVSWFFIINNWNSGFFYIQC